MSEPVSNAEIEDVLSSIRRLVSSDAEASQHEITPEPAAPEPAGKLILTADFRVAEPRDESVEPRDEIGVAEAEEVHPAEDHVAVDVSDDVVVEAEDDVAVESAADIAVEFHHTEHTPEAEAEAEDVFVAEVEAEVEVEDAQVEDSAGPEHWQAAADSVEHADAPDESVSALEDTIAELEATIGQQGGDWEPDGSGFEEDAEAEDVMSEPVQDWIEGTAEDLDADAAVDAGEADSEDEDPDLFGSEESVIDEETLRDMVSDIVRQELQGALGERITRNVRKLVRREINRVLASQDFE